MILGQRIQERLDAEGLSQAALARRLKLSQGAINGLINGRASGSRYVHLIARELHTTPAYLTGETDDPESDSPFDVITGHEREWLEVLRELEAADRKVALTVARALAGARAALPPTLHEPQREYRTGTHG
jgi:transcriptional regulator with XRE-family HTH domain